MNMSCSANDVRHNPFGMQFDEFAKEKVGPEECVFRNVQKTRNRQKQPRDSWFAVCEAFFRTFDHVHCFSIMFLTMQWFAERINCDILESYCM